MTYCLTILAMVVQSEAQPGIKMVPVMPNLAKNRPKRSVEILLLDRQWREGIIRVNIVRKVVPIIYYGIGNSIVSV